MGKTVKELLREISSEELTEWMAYYQIEPFGEFRADVRAGIIASTLANVNRGKNSKTFRPEDFMPEFDERYVIKPKQSQEELAASIWEIFGPLTKKKRKHK